MLVSEELISAHCLWGHHLMTSQEGGGQALGDDSTY